MPKWTQPVQDLLLQSTAPPTFNGFVETKMALHSHSFEQLSFIFVKKVSPAKYVFPSKKQVGGAHIWDEVQAVEPSGRILH